MCPFGYEESITEKPTLKTIYLQLLTLFKLVLVEAKILLMKHIKVKYVKKAEQDIKLLENTLNTAKAMK